MRNKRLSDYRLRRLILCFCVDVTATQAVVLLGLNRNTLNRWYGIFRRAIYAHQEALKESLVGRVEMDESYFGASRVRGFHGKRKRGRGTSKQPVFGIFEREGRVYTEIV
ncbi:IS1595 family transposase, partial [Candidatus Parcubacteria bacterium]